MAIKSSPVGRDQSSRPTIVHVASLVLVGLVATAGAIDGLVVGVGIVHPTSLVAGYIGSTLMLSCAAIGATLLAVLGGNLVNPRTRGQFVPILVTTEMVAVVLAFLQTWLLRNVVSQDYERAFLLGSLLVLALAGSGAATRFRSVRSHGNLAITGVSVVVVLVFTAAALFVVWLVYVFASSPSWFS
jgi:hypothetical protein